MMTAAHPVSGIHLDLKYTMPNKQRLLRWLERLPGWGIDTVLVEYEDKFPYAAYPFLRHPEGFTVEELAVFLQTARKCGLQVIPLVPSLSHLEFALAHEELAALREAPDIPTMLCPSRPEAVRFVKTLCREVLDAHPDAEFFHLGGDEAWFLGTCPACAARAGRDGALRVWAEHERELMEFVLAHGKRPIVWDDALWQTPDAIGSLGLPSETVLHVWDYHVAGGKAGHGGQDAELGAGGTLGRVDVYRRAGFDCLAGPCCNIGQLFPRHTLSLRNAQAWARKARAAGMLGTINTAWAVFHIPLEILGLYVAATGELGRDPDANLDAAWQTRWIEREFGCPAEGLPEALEVLSAGWEIPMPAYGRPFTPLVYGYMNMVLHYPGRQDERRRRGSYPLDWREVDFRAVYRKGVEEARQCPEQNKMRETLDRKLAAFPAAAAAVRGLAERATRHRDEAAMLAVLADLKYIGLRVFGHLLRGEGNAADLNRELGALDGPLRSALAQAWEPEGRERMRRAFWEPMAAALGAGAVKG
jgi:hypothetical protein